MFGNTKSFIMTIYCTIVLDKCCIMKEKERMKKNESIDGVYLFICCCVPTCEVDCKEMKILCGKKNWAVVCNVNLFIFQGQLQNL